MRNILVATDFSVPAENAAQYAIQLAKLIKANVTLCNAYKVPAEAPMAERVAWPLLEEQDIEGESENSLAEMVRELTESACDPTDRFCPKVEFESEKGEVVQVVKELVKRRKIDLVIMGMAGAGQLIQWALGSNSNAMIDKADFPVLYVPSTATFQGIKKIAFATDLTIDDLAPLQLLCSLAKSISAEIKVYHITSFEARRIEEESDMDRDFYENVVVKLDYEKITYENIWHSDIHEGLKWIKNNKEIDMIAMVHQQHNLIDKLIHGSYVHKLSRFTEVPLLVFQPIQKTAL